MSASLDSMPMERILPAETVRVLGETRGRVDGEVLALAWEPSGALLTIEDGGILRRLAGNDVRQLARHDTGELESCWAISSGGNLAAGGGLGISLWDLATGAQIGRIEDRSWTLTISFDPTGRLLATGHDDGQVRLWDVGTGRLLRAFDGHTDELTALAFSPDGEVLASAAEDRLVILWNVSDGGERRRLAGHTDRVEMLAWSNAGDRLFSAAWDTSVRVWHPDAGRLMALLNGQGECVHSVIPLSDGRIACGDSEGWVRVWNPAELKILWEARRHAGPVKRLALAADGVTLLSAGVDRVVLLSRIDRPAPTEEAAPTRSPVVTLARTDGDTLLALHAEGVVREWAPLPPPPAKDDSTLGKLPKRETRGRIVDDSGVSTALATFTDGLVLGDRHGQIEVRPIPGSASVSPRRWAGHHLAVRKLAVNGAGDLAASTAGSDGVVKVWNLRTGELEFVVPLAEGACAVESIAFHPTRNLLAVAGINWAESETEEEQVWLWDVREKRQLGVFEGVCREVVFHPEGRLMAALDDGEAVVVWDFESGEVVLDAGDVGATLNAVAFSNDLLAAAGEDGGIRVWTIADGQHRATIDVESRVRALSFHRDGVHLTAGNGDSTCLDLDLGDLLPER
jgi:WD40 repeat protein